MVSIACCTQGLVSCAVRDTWMEEEAEKEKVFGVFMEARILSCCDGSFMNECILYS